MKRLFLSLITLTILLAGCNQSTSPEEIAKIAYEWEEAKFNNNYTKQQELIFEKGSYEVDKGSKKIDSGLNYDDIQFEVYFDTELEHYYVFANFDNPNGDNAVEDNVVLREKNDEWKVDTSHSLDVSREEIKEKLERKSCIHCE
ncbi:hypothetical protein ABFG93_22420 (plasmid) [Pseudalkalibacillus hwajinpoensis]|uniref:hypothetical protein n=1 Tax=Guptibacillus hwajinpoensis TaxID=208199 RepID=UPI00325B4D1D